jgi:hypothetical protein
VPATKKVDAGAVFAVDGPVRTAVVTTTPGMGAPPFVDLCQDYYIRIAVRCNELLV